MSEVTTIGIDLAKTVFQVHGVDAGGMVLVRKTIRRAQVLSFFRALLRCLVGMEACATAQYWAREIAALGHEVRLMPPQYVKASVKRNKNDAADAEAICEAVRRPAMRFVPVKTDPTSGVRRNVMRGEVRRSGSRDVLIPQTRSKSCSVFGPGSRFRADLHVRPVERLPPHRHPAATASRRTIWPPPSAAGY